MRCADAVQVPSESHRARTRRTTESLQRSAQPGRQSVFVPCTTEGTIQFPRTCEADRQQKTHLAVLLQVGDRRALASSVTGWGNRVECRGRS